MEHAGNDKKYFKKILDEFLIEYDDSVEYIRMLIEKHEFETANKYCHPLKNTLANIGAFRLSYLVDLMEKAFADKSLGEIESLYKMYPKEYKETVKEIESFQFHALKNEG
jgi:HPt (histidine-containing phosphotransfer) domain-containing protein